MHNKSVFTAIPPKALYVGVLTGNDVSSSKALSVLINSCYREKYMVYSSPLVPAYISMSLRSSSLSALWDLYLRAYETEMYVFKFHLLGNVLNKYLCEVFTACTGGSVLLYESNAFVKASHKYCLVMLAP